MNSERQLYDVRPGDVFGIPFHGGNYQVGQVIDEHKGALYVVVFDSTAATPSPGLEAVSAALGTPPLLARMTFDSRFRPGMWEIFGARPQTAGGSFPPTLSRRRRSKVWRSPVSMVPREPP